MPDYGMLADRIANDLVQRSAELDQERDRLKAEGRLGVAEARRLRRDSETLAAQMLRLLEFQSPESAPISTHTQHPLLSAGPDELLFLQQLDTLTDKELLCALSSARWPEGFRCPACGRTESQLIAARRAARCVSCGTFSSLLAATPMANTHLNLRVWISAAWAMARHPDLSACTLAPWIGVTRAGSVGRMRHKLLALPALRSASGKRLTLNELLHVLVGPAVGPEASSVSAVEK